MVKTEKPEMRNSTALHISPVTKIIKGRNDNGKIYIWHLSSHQNITLYIGIITISKAPQSPMLVSRMHNVFGSKHLTLQI